MTEASKEPDDTMRRRAGARTWKVSLLLGTRRSDLVAAFLGTFFVVLAILGWLDPLGMGAPTGGGDPIETLFQALVTAIVTGVTLVVTINQLVLSQELGAAGDQRERLDGALEFRESVADALDVPVSPQDPAAFLRAVLEATTQRAADLDDAVGSADSADVAASVEDYVSTVTDHADAVIDKLEGASFGSFDVVAAALDFNYSWKLAEARRLRTVGEDELSTEAHDALDDLEELLEHFAVGREHVKTLYFQWELIDLSRGMLVTSIPALLTAIGMILFVDVPGSFQGATLGMDHAILAVAAGTSVALLPFALLFATILRIATVAKRTLAIGPFVLRESEGETPGEE